MPNKRSIRTGFCEICQEPLDNYYSPFCESCQDDLYELELDRILEEEARCTKKS